MRSWRLYGLFDPRDFQLRYVGVTSLTTLRRFHYMETAAVRDSEGLTPARIGRASTSSWLQELMTVGRRPLMLVQEEFEDETSAFAAEVKAIAFYRHQNAPLLNKANGGKGCPGALRSPEWRARHGAANKGKVRSKEMRRRVAKGLGGAPFKDELGRTYHNIHEAGERLGIAYQNIWKVLQGKRPHAEGHRFRYLSGSQKP